MDLCNQFWTNFNETSCNASLFWWYFHTQCYLLLENQLKWDNLTYFCVPFQVKMWISWHRHSGDYLCFISYEIKLMRSNQPPAKFCFKWDLNRLLFNFFNPISAVRSTHCEDSIRIWTIYIENSWILIANGQKRLDFQHFWSNLTFSNQIIVM